MALKVMAVIFVGRPIGATGTKKNSLNKADGMWLFIKEQQVSL